MLSGALWKGALGNTLPGDLNMSGITNKDYLQLQRLGIGSAGEPLP